MHDALGPDDGRGQLPRHGALAANGLSAAEQLDQLWAMFDGAPVQIYAKDLEGRYVLCNREVLSIWGLDADAVLGRADAELWPEHAAAYEAHDREVVAAGHALVADEVAVVDGHPRTYLSFKFPLRDPEGTIYATAGVSSDITDRADDARVLRRAVEEADQANAAKSEFLSRMSHDLRTPLNSILGFAQLLGLSELDAPDAESVEQILKAGQHLLGLINEVLDIARIEAGRLAVSIESVPIGASLAEAIALVQPAADELDVTIAVQPGVEDLYALADHQRLLQVWLNLLSNALKYNRPGGRVDVTARRVDDRVRLEIADTGRGIAAGDLERIFEMFERLDAESLGFEGTGIGLSLCRELLALMGGRIGVASTVGVGSTFWFELGTAPDPNGAPLAAVPAGPADPAPTGAPPLTVLSIEDNPANRLLVERILERRPGTRLLTAIQGRMGLELARLHHPDLVLLDMHLPDVTGLEVLRELRADPATAGIAVWVLSADATDRQQTRARDAGADGYLTKPIAVSALLDLLDDLGRHRDRSDSF